jgi:hypothetical protein
LEAILLLKTKNKNLHPTKNLLSAQSEAFALKFNDRSLINTTNFLLEITQNKIVLNVSRGLPILLAPFDTESNAF